jgi:hypothetical protein
MRRLAFPSTVGTSSDTPALRKQRGAFFTPYEIAEFTAGRS